MQLAELSRDADAWLSCFGSATSEPMSAPREPNQICASRQPRKCHNKLGFHFLVATCGNKTPGLDLFWRALEKLILPSLHPDHEPCLHASWASGQRSQA